MSKNYQPTWYSDDATVAKFLMGGIGTGNVSIGSRGQLCDWEIFNHSMIGGKLPYTFFAVRTEDAQRSVGIKILESRLKAPFENSHGLDTFDCGGIGRFESARMCGKISRAAVELRDDSFPVQAYMDAFSPFIPLNAKDSGIPGFVLRYRLKNTSDHPQHVSVVGSLGNAIGFAGYGRFRHMLNEGIPRNQYRETPGLKGIYMDNPELPERHLTNGSMVLATTSRDHVTVKDTWFQGEWIDCAHEFWNDFESDGMLEKAHTYRLLSAIDGKPTSFTIGSVCVDFDLQPGEEHAVEYILSWYIPFRVAGWEGHMFPAADPSKTVRNYYATIFSDAWNVSAYLAEQLSRLEAESDAFSNAFYATDMPDLMLDAATANITVMRSNTCWRIENGLFLGWEGCFDNAGCCEGNCSHVWNYQQAVAFLFPELERTMRYVNFILETDDDGEMAYRANSMFSNPRYTVLPPAADGQMGTIIQLYRDWKLSGDDDFLRQMWGKAVLALDYAAVKWDQDHDGVFEAQQHNTYDIEFYGATSMLNSIYYTALLAAAEMADYLGDHEKAEKYRTIYQKGSAKMDAMLFNGEYYEQKLPGEGYFKYQYEAGCLADQLLGQELAHIVGLGYVLPENHVRQALQSIFKYNFKGSFNDHLNVQRTYALNDDKGLLCCTWPRGGRPEIPFIYSDEVWTGIEYQVATHLIYEGCKEEALAVVEAVRSRYNGIKRNPWNEVECGNHYVRSMSSWGLLLAASGFGFDLTKGEIWFNPAYDCDDYHTFFSTGKCWGVYTQKTDPATGTSVKNIEILYGDKSSVKLKE